MGQIFLNPLGNGNAYCDNYNPSNGQPFTIYCVPDPGEDLLEVRAFDSHDYSVAIDVDANLEVHATFRSLWGNLYVDIYFTGSTPPQPTPKAFPFWIFFKKKRRIKNVNY